MLRASESQDLTLFNVDLTVAAASILFSLQTKLGPDSSFCNNYNTSQADAQLSADPTLPVLPLAPTISTARVSSREVVHWQCINVSTLVL